MRIRNAVLIITALVTLVACGESANGPNDPGDGGGGGGGGPAGNIRVGSGIQFVSAHNGTTNPAVDTVSAGDTVTWTWGGNLPHSVRSAGGAFAGSPTFTGNGTHRVAFTTPGVFQYDCREHGNLMTGRIVVIAPEGITATAADPAGDTFGGGGVQWDVTSLTLRADTADVTVLLDFSADLISPVTGDPAAMVAFVDLDIDQDSTTGLRAIADEFRTDGGSTGLGADYLLNLGVYAMDSTVALIDREGVEVGRIKPVFTGRRLTARIPKTLLDDDDDALNAAVIVGRTGGPTDIVPNTASLTLRG
jgi:plastocyanin